MDNETDAAMKIKTAGSGNVFENLDRANADEALVKARLAEHIIAVIDRRRLTQEQVARVLGIEEPRVSQLLDGRLGEFSTDRLLCFLRAFDQDVQIVVKRKPRWRKRATLSVVAF